MNSVGKPSSTIPLVAHRGYASRPWAWFVYETTDPIQALELMARGVSLIETLKYTELVAGLAERERS